MDTLSNESIRQIAFETTGQRYNPYWSEMRQGRLTASNFGKAIRAADTHHPTAVNALKDAIFNPRSLDHVKAVQWGCQNESKGVDLYGQRTGKIVKPTGLWMFANGMLCAAPDGVVFEKEHITVPIGILEVKCPYSIRDTPINGDADWNKNLPYLDENNNLKHTDSFEVSIQQSHTMEPRLPPLSLALDGNSHVCV